MEQVTHRDFTRKNYQKGKMSNMSIEVFLFKKLLAHSMAIFKRPVVVVRAHEGKKHQNLKRFCAISHFHQETA